QLISVMDASTPPYLQDVGAVRLAFTQNVNISTIRLSTPIDGILPAEGDRVLLKDQTTKSENGVWIARGSGVWTRPALQYISHNQMTFVGLV
ncbi:hypothetical protein ACI4BE_28045, partial [Klebsiella pneumoniae]|uniref:hypothetical protein n=1 Tax=Klebsiella pneumoniae TaxID=573 RepID=UPI00385280D5